MTIDWQERIGALGAKIGSPDVLPEIEDAIRNVEKLHDALVRLRDLAVHMHGDANLAAIEHKKAGPPVDLSHSKVVQSKLSISDLVDFYRTHDKSAYHALRFRTREHYETLLKRIARDYGSVSIANIRQAEIEQFYENWKSGGTTLPLAHSLITMLRSLVYFGGATLEDPECIRLAVQLRSMRFDMLKGRTAQLTIEHVVRIIDMAHSRGRPSIAMAQAIQFECNLPQKDVIGEWVPLDEPEDGIVYGDKKWLRGIRWEEIDANFVLHHKKSKSGQHVSIDLKPHRLTMIELERLEKSRLFKGPGPIIICETTDEPWVAGEFRRWWRKIAKATGVPNTVRNSDGRRKAAESRGRV